MTIRLKIKIKSLATEAVIIRKEERKALGSARWSKDRQGHESQASDAYSLYHCLRSHRTKEVRIESRYSHLAYGFLRGKKFNEVESNAKANSFISYSKLADMANRFKASGAPRISADDISKWHKAGLAEIAKRS